MQIDELQQNQKLKRMKTEISRFQMQLELRMRMESEYLNDGSPLHDIVKKFEIHEMW